MCEVICDGAYGIALAFDLPCIAGQRLDGIDDSHLLRDNRCARIRALFSKSQERH